MCIHVKNHHKHFLSIFVLREVNNITFLLIFLKKINYFRPKNHSLTKVDAVRSQYEEFSNCCCINMHENAADDIQHSFLGKFLESTPMQTTLT